MATNIPPHNLREVTNAAIKIIDNRIEEDRETDIEELLEYKLVGFNPDSEKQQEADSLRQQVQEERERRLAAVVRLSELSKLSAGVAKKSSQDDMIKAMRSYLNTSKRKTLGKREAAKMVFTELLTSAKVELPEDITDLLEHLDDEQSEPKVVHVSGSYNDIHDNSSVDFRTEE